MSRKRKTFFPMASDSILVDENVLHAISKKAQTGLERIRAITKYLGSRKTLMFADIEKMGKLFDQSGDALGDFMAAYYAAIDRNYPGRGPECQFCRYRIESKKSQRR